MGVEKLSKSVQIIQNLGDNPNTDDNLSAEELKAKFDEAAVILKNYINETLVPFINSLDSAFTASLDETLTDDKKAAQAKAVGDAIKTLLSKSGGTMTGAINMGSKKITNLATPTADADASTKKYVDDGLNGKQDTITGLKPSMAMICDQYGKVTASSVVTTGELGYLSGARANIQNQLDDKEPTITTLALEKGGTGATTANEATYKIIGGMPETTAAVNDESLFVFRRTTPSVENGTVFYKKAPLLVDYLSQKLVPRFVQIWNNTSSGSNFADQVLDIDVTGFDFIMVRYKVYKTTQAGTYHCALIKTSGAGILETVSQSGKYRGVSFPTTGGVRIGNVYNADDTEGTNDFIIPFEIYGCKLYTKK